MREIEVKGWVDDFAAVKARLDAEARFAREVTKRDLYYGPEGKRPEAVRIDEDRVFRLRSEGERWLVTAKVRHLAEGVEVNDEIEVGIDCSASFRAFAQYLGYRPFIVKRKQTREYDFGRAKLELSRLDPLGDFLEVEVLLEGEPTDEEIAEAQDEVRSYLAYFGVPEERIEARPYVDLLRKIGAGRPEGR